MAGVNFVVHKYFGLVISPRKKLSAVFPPTLKKKKSKMVGLTFNVFFFYFYLGLYTWWESKSSNKNFSV